MGGLLTNFLFSSESDLDFAGYQLLSLTATKVNRSTFSEKLHEHPDYPSLLSIKDVLESFGMETLAIRPHSEQWAEVNIPFLTQTVANETQASNFTVVRPVSEENWEYLHPKSRKWTPVHQSEFTQRFMPLALFTEANEQAGETDYEQVRLQDLQAAFSTSFKSVVLPFSALAILLGWFFLAQDVSIAQALYFTSMLAGAVVGGLLLLFEIDKHNPIIKQVCSGGNTKTNCHAVLDSAGGKFLGISWSLVGFTYFLGGTLLMMFTAPYQNPYFPYLSLMSLAVVPYVGYSLYYQARIIKQWCRLCLATQTVLIIQAALVLMEGWWKIDLTQILGRELFSMIFVYLLLFILGETLARTGKKAKEGEKHQQSFKRLKSNTRIFESLLDRERSVAGIPADLGIILGNPEARHTLIKVCNPYCGPCAKAHPDIANLLKQNRDLKVQIIFTATGEDDDSRTPPVRHLLAIALKGEEVSIEKALNDWYLADNKNYDVFASKYPMNGDLEKQGGMIDRMHEWCQAAEIRHTPTYFINGRELPDIYKIADLDYFLKS